MSQKIIVCATNYGVWGEELQAPWDALRDAGHDLTLATPQGKKPLPLQISVDPSFMDPMQNYQVNPPQVCDRVKELVAGQEWANPKRFKDLKMADYDSIVVAGGLGSMLDLGNNPALHRLVLDAYYADKMIGMICYANAVLAFTARSEGRLSQHHQWSPSHGASAGVGFRCGPELRPVRGDAGQQGDRSHRAGLPVPAAGPSDGCGRGKRQVHLHRDGES